MDTYIKLSDQKQKEFGKELLKRINHHFTSNNISRKANTSLIIKGIVVFAVLLVPYYIFMTQNLSFGLFFLFYILHTFGQVLVAFNIGHDANHNALSNNKFINKLGYFTYDLVGVNSYVWRLMHTKGHHPNINIPDLDQSIMGRKLFRFSPDQVRETHHKWQHIYVFFFYGLVTIDYVFFRDFVFLFHKNNPYFKDMKHPFKEYVFLIASKLFYITYTLIIPIVFLDFSWYLIILTFIIGHFIGGSLMAFIFQTTHTVEDTFYPKTKKDYKHFLVHIFATTADYSWRNRSFNWLMGGLNMHVAHHISPTTCHVHYYDMTKIAQATAKSFDIPYRENKTFLKAIKSHIALLKDLGNHDQLSKVDFINS